MSVSSKMTAIADKIRALLGISGTMGLDAMAANLATEQTNVTNAFTSISGKGGTVPSAKVSGNLATAINSIPSGVTVQKKTGTFRTNSSGKATISVGFKPDVIAFSMGISPSGQESYPAAMFTEANNDTITILITPADPNNYAFTQLIATRTATGAGIELYKVNYSFAGSPETSRTVSYAAIKYT